MSYRVDIKVKHERPFYSNALRFDTEADAKEYGEHKSAAWTAVEHFRVVEEPTERICYTTEPKPVTA